MKEISGPASPEYPPGSGDVDVLKLWLRKLESENPAFKNLFLINADGTLISSSVSLGWGKRTEVRSFVNQRTVASFNTAGKAEILKKTTLNQ